MGQKYCQECGQPVKTPAATTPSDTARVNELPTIPSAEDCLHTDAKAAGSGRAYCRICNHFVDLDSWEAIESADPVIGSNCPHLSLEKDLRGPNGERICVSCGLPLSSKALADLEGMRKVANSSPVGWTIIGLTLLVDFGIIAFSLSSDSNSNSNSTATPSTSSTDSQSGNGSDTHSAAYNSGYSWVQNLTVGYLNQYNFGSFYSAGGGMTTYYAQSWCQQMGIRSNAYTQFGGVQSLSDWISGCTDGAVKLADKVQVVAGIVTH